MTTGVGSKLTETRQNKLARFGDVAKFANQCAERH